MKYIEVDGLAAIVEVDEVAEVDDADKVDEAVAVDEVGIARVAG